MTPTAAPLPTSASRQAPAGQSRHADGGPLTPTSPTDKQDGRHIRWGWDCCPPGHPSIETEALSQQTIVGIARAWLDQLLPEPLADVLVRERAQRAALAAALARLDGDGGRR